jgi:very-short-patch-repair endonuclease
MNTTIGFKPEELRPDELILGGEVGIPCPACGFNCTHIDTVEIATASGRGARIEAHGEDDGSGVTVSELTCTIPSAWGLRRHQIMLHGYCENGCSFTLSLVQHKGATLQRITCQKRQSFAEAPTFDSPPEREFWDAYEATRPAALDGLVSQHKVPPYRLDFAVPDKKFGIEVDGLAYHNGQESFIADRRRQRSLERQGWRIVRFAAKEVTEDPHGCVQQAADLATK